MKTISIIGSGGMAAAIGGRIAKAGYGIEVLSRDPANAKAFAEKLGAGAKTGTYRARPSGDIVILAVPYKNAETVLADFGDTLKDKVIIDITNPLADDLSGVVTPSGSSGAQEIAKHVPASAHIVKAFNTIFGHVLARGERLDAFIAADDSNAKKLVSALLEGIGLRPLDVGGLRMAQTLEAIGLMMIGIAKNGAGTWDLALKVDIGSSAQSKK